MPLKKKSSALLASLENPDYCDVKIEALDGLVGANKTILSITSQYFCRTFNNNLMEGNSGSVKLPYSKAVVEKVVTYHYSGEMEYEGMDLGQLLDLLEFLNMITLFEEFSQVEKYTVEKVKNRTFSYSDCLKNLDKSSRMRMEAVEEALRRYLGNYLHRWCDLKEVEGLSETMITRLAFNRDYSGQIIHRFRALVTWLAANPQTAERRTEFLKLLDFNQFSAKQLASDVRSSGLYSSDRIIARLEEICREQEEKLLKEKNVETQYLNIIDEQEVELEEKNYEVYDLKSRLEEKETEIENLKKKLAEETSIWRVYRE